MGQGNGWGVTYNGYDLIQRGEEGRGRDGRSGRAASGGVGMCWEGR